MNSVAEPHPLPADEAVSPAADLQIQHHPAFCQLALPVRSPVGGTWSRDVGTAAVTIEAREAGGDGTSPIPTGKYLRLLLMHLFSAAVHSNSASVDVGASAADLAAAMGLETSGPKLRELGEQYERLVSAKLTVSVGGKPAISVFDARGRARSATEWRSGVKLNARFLESLVQTAVPLDPGVVIPLVESTLALDAYTWCAATLRVLPPGGSLPMSWEELLARFGTANAKMEEFKAAFDQALQQVSAAFAGVALVMREHGIEIRHSERDRRRQAKAAAPSPAPEPVAVAAVEPVAERAPERRPERPSEPMSERAAEPPVERAPVPQAARPAPPPAQPTPGPARAAGDRVGLKHHVTGLSQVIWLQRGNGRDDVLLEVTPGGRYDPENLTVLALEPIVVQISGGLYQRDFERVGAWANVNRDLIDDFWDGELANEDEVIGRVKKVPAPGWR